MAGVDGDLVGGAGAVDVPVSAEQHDRRALAANGARSSWPLSMAIW